MSRLCVKNLPKYVGEDRLRDFFSQKGEVTDAKLMKTKDGKSRQFAFVGFHTEREAEEALKFFNNSYIDTCRITCEVARKVGDPNIPRPWSKYSAKKENATKENKKELVRDKSDSLPKGLESSNKEGMKSKSIEKNDPKLQEFLQVMQPRAKTKIWADDNHNLAQLDQDGKAGMDEIEFSKTKRKKQAGHVLGQVIDDSNKANNLADMTSCNSSVRGCPETNSIEKSNRSAHDDAISDMDYFRSRVKKDFSDSETDDEDLHDRGLHSAKIMPLELASEDYNVEMDEDQIHGGKDQEKSMLQVSSNGSDAEDSENPTALTSDEKQGLETGRLFIRNLPYTTNEDELLELFSQFGDVSQVHLIVDKDTKRSKGIGYVLFKLPECALRALEELDNSIFQGRLLHVMPAKPQKIDAPNLETDLGQDKHNFKQRREDQRKAFEASGDTRAWNSLFMRQDTVVENIARKHGISKTDLLDREADDLAVRIALGETQVIADTKKSLSSAGVNIAALEKFTSSKKDNSKRSNHVILVKNLPYGSSEGDLAELFGKFGSLEKIILPPTKAMALIIFLEAAEARAAFRGLAYKRYKDAPLYLEWAPDDIFSPGQKFEQDELNNTAVPEQATKSVLVEQTLGGRLDDDIDPDRVESRTLFVKNLNFKTTDELLRKHFSDLIKTGSIKSVKVQKHIKNGKNLSMGFGFIELDSVETTSNVCKDLQGTILDGHALHLQVCHAKKADLVQKKTDKDLSSTKLIVRNVAFEATEKELRQLFSPFGQIKSLRLPMKFGSHRGFAFVEFVTKQEAQNALQSLSSTHFYGRHLVLERAKEGESLEELRARTAAQFVDEHNGFQKLSKKRKLTEQSK